MYSTRSGLIIGFHGCDENLVEQVILQKTELEPSRNAYDWLGHGMYFWENNPLRAIQFAKEQNKRQGSKVKKPAVIGAVIDLGFCLDLLDAKYLRMMRAGYSLLEATVDAAEMPKNKPLKSSSDLLLRNLDCAVIETIHAFRSEEKVKSFDSVRGVF